MNADNLVPANVPALKLASIGASGLFCGGAVYALAADFPSLKEHSHGCILKILRLKFRRVARLQMPLVVLSSAAGITLYFMDKEKHFSYLVSGCLMGAIGPLTKFAILPVVSPMIEPDAKDKMSEEEVRASLATFEKLHTVRCLFGLSAFGYLLYQLIK